MRYRSLAFLMVVLPVVSARGQTLVYSLNGSADYDQFGASVSDAGDVDRDGWPDFIIGSPLELAGGVSVGAARVYSGRNGSPLLVFEGDRAQGFFGTSVNGGADFNGDGVVDLMVGAPSDPSLDAGYARALSGKDGTILFTVRGEIGGFGLGDKFGYSVSNAGDVDGDGFADAIVGAPWHGSLHHYDGGLARVFSGRDGSVLWTFNGTTPGSEGLGFSVSGGDDVNADGFADVIVGAPGATDGVGNPVGAALVYSGRSGAALWQWYGDPDGAEFGGATSTARDMNNDGFADVLVGAVGQPVTLRSGRVRVYSGKDGSILHQVDGAPGDRLGGSVSDAGDVDADGVPDFIVGAPSAASYAGEARVYSGRDASEITRLLPPLPRPGLFGLSVSAAGDVDRDGNADLLVGWPHDYDEPGAAWVVSGRDSPAAWTTYGTGWPGRDGVPLLVMGQDPQLCRTVTLMATSSSSSPMRAGLVLGARDASLPTSWDGTLLVLPLRFVAVRLQASVQSWQMPLPCDPTLRGLAVYLQLIEMDGHASKGLSFTPGLEVLLDE